MSQTSENNAPRNFHISTEDEMWLGSNGVWLSRGPCPQTLLSARSIFLRCMKTPDSDLPMFGPAANLINVVLVGSVLSHDDIDIDGRSLEAKLRGYLEHTFKDSFLIAANPKIDGYMTISNFSYHIFEHMFVGNLTTPFLLVSSDFRFSLFWDFDLEYTIFSSVEPVSKGVFDSDHIEEWDNLFSRRYLEFVPKGQLHKQVFETYLAPNIGRAINLSD